jgi:hypothetical protein
MSLIQSLRPGGGRECYDQSEGFISYAHESDEHKAWVRRLATDLVQNGVNARVDQWWCQPGASLTQFMAREVELNDYVLCVCTPTSAEKCTQGRGGVDFEQQIISGSILAGVGRERFIPVVRKGSFGRGDDAALPAHFLGIHAIDMRRDEQFDEKLIEVLRVVFQAPQYQPPPLGTPPEFVHRDRVALAPEGSIDEGATEGLLAFDCKLEAIGGPKAIELALDELRARGVSDPADELIISIEGYSSLEKRLTQVMQSPPKTLEQRQERMDLRKQIGAFRLRGQPPEIVLKKIASLLFILS